MMLGGLRRRENCPDVRDGPSRGFPYPECVRRTECEASAAAVGAAAPVGKNYRWSRDSAAETRLPTFRPGGPGWTCGRAGADSAGAEGGLSPVGLDWPLSQFTGTVLQTAPAP